MENESQGVHLILFTGKRVEFTVDEFLALLKEPLVYIIIIFAISINYFLMVSSGAGGQVLSAILWGISVAVTIFVYFGTILFLCTTNAGPSDKPVFEPFITLFSALLSSLFAGPLFVHGNIIASLKFYMTIEALAATFFAAQVGILLYVYYMRPQIIARLDYQNPEPDTTLQTHIHIGGKTFSASRLRYVKSENQYIHIYTDFNDTILLGSIKAVAEQLDDSLGMIVHRSYYVMRRDVLRVEKDGTSKSLILSDDTNVPLARRRIAEVEVWLKQGNGPVYRSTIK